MKNNKMKTKAIVLSLGLAAMMLLSTIANAQQGYDGSRGMFMRGTGLESNDRGDGIGLGGAESENPTPVGSGIAILMAAGAGYALLKRKEDKQ